MPVNITRDQFSQVGINQKIGYDEATNQPTHRPAHKGWLGRTVGWLHNLSPAHRSEKQEIMQAFLASLKSRYGADIGAQAFGDAIGEVRGKSLSGRQIKAAFARADQLTDANRLANQTRIVRQGPGGTHFGGILSELGLRDSDLSSSAKKSIGDRLTFPPVRLEKEQIGTAEIRSKSKNLTQTEHRLASFMPGGSDFARIAGDLGINPSKLDGALGDRLRSQVHKLGQDGQQAVAQAAIEDTLRTLMPQALNDLNAIRAYNDHNVPALVPGGGDFDRIISELGGSPGALGGKLKATLKATVEARIDERSRMAGPKGLAPAELRGIAKQTAANVILPLDKALANASPDGSIKTVDLVHQIDDAIHDRLAAARSPRPSFAQMLATVKAEVENTATLSAPMKDRTLTVLYGMERKGLAEARLAGELQKHDAYKDFDPAQMWRLVIDGRCHDKFQADGSPNALYRGEFGYENEAGYTGGVLNAMHEMLKHLDDDLTPDMYRQLHDLCVDGVLDRDKTLGDPAGPKLIEKDFRNNGYAAFGCDSRGSLSRAGLREAEARARSDDWFEIRNGTESDFDKGEPVTVTFHCHPRSADQCRDRVDTILTAYYDAIGRAGSEDAKLDAIIRCCQDLEQSHIFTDANLRTVGFVVLQKFLIENDLSPTIMDNPNIFDGHSVAEIRAAIKAGQTTFEGFC